MSRSQDPAAWVGRRESAPPTLRILFVCGDDFRSPAEKQALGFAQQLAARGHQVALSIGGDPATAFAESGEQSPGVEIFRHRFHFRNPSAESLARAEEFAPLLIHAFNPRVPVVAAARAYARRTGAAVFVHFEDDEWYLRKGSPPGGSPYRRLGRLGRRAACRLHPPLWYNATLSSLRWVGRHGRGLDALTPALAQHVSGRLGRECAVVPPITPRAPSRPASPPLPSGFADTPMVVYTGPIFPVYQADLTLGLRAVAEVQRRGIDVKFVHSGGHLSRLDPQQLAAQAGVLPGTAAFLGYLPREQLEGLLRAGTILLQTGRPNEHNRLRLPSKLQTYLPSGTPTITFSVGFGELLKDREEVVKTYTEHPAELADRIVELLMTPELRSTLSRGGPRAARRLFDPDRNVETLLAHYRRQLRAGREPGAPSGTLDTTG